MTQLMLKQAAEEAAMEKRNQKAIEIVCLIQAQLRKAKSTIKCTFKVLDLDGSGDVGIDEMEAMCRKLGVSLKEGDAEALMELIDEDGGGSITVDEMADVMKRLRSTQRDHEAKKRLAEAAAAEERESDIEMKMKQLDTGSFRNSDSHLCMNIEEVYQCYAGEHAPQKTELQSLNPKPYPSS